MSRAWERGSTRQWRTLRAHILRRDKGCRLCGAPATDVDHIRARSAGGTDHPDNLQALCVPCHRAKTATETRTAITHRPRAKRPPEAHPGLL